MTAGALALAVISPALDPAEHAAEAVPPAEHAGSDQTAAAFAATEAERSAATERASRVHERRTTGERRPAATPLALRTLATGTPLPEMSPEAYEEARHEAVQAAVALTVADQREALRGPAAEAAAEAREALRHGPQPLREGPEALGHAAGPLDGTGLAGSVAGPLYAGPEMVRSVVRALPGVATNDPAAAIRKAAARVAAIRRATAKAAARAARAERNAREQAREQARARAHKRAVRVRAVTRAVITRHTTARRAQRVVPLGGGMTAVIAFARSQVGKRYVHGGTGPFGFDCSGFTKRAYALAGIHLPHSSGAQAAQARSISTGEARPGDLVVGPGHVGIYMGRGMMIDAGNSRTGVVYRKLYSGLHVERLK
ncbi:C40 family peptidase [Actinoplanes sp. NPDC048796]|uniref:C40 family peptidase n=1 Tax=Actinoplanes sp. NPDC048796 TaxID=3155640 RepID=UPI0033D625BD